MTVALSYKVFVLSFSIFYGLQSNVAKFFSHIVQSHDTDLLQQAVDALHKWTQKWYCILTPKKCKVASYGRNVDKTYTYTNY